MALNLDKLSKVRALMERGSTEHERAAATRKAEGLAKAAGMTLDAALSKLDSAPQPTAPSLFEGFDDWMEAKEPGYKARQAAKRTEREAREAQRREKVLAACGSVSVVFARTEREVLLDAAIAHLATWDYWTDDSDGAVHRFAKDLDGKGGDFWDVKHITPAIREAVMGAYPWPATLADALAEVKAWDCLAEDRALFCQHSEWVHYSEVKCRVLLLEDELETSRPVTSWDDMQARFDWKRYAYERTYIDPGKRDEPFLDRLEADFAFLRAAANAVQFGHGDASPIAHRTTAQKRAAVLSMLDARPDLSDREIARRLSVSPQTVSTWRKKSASEISVGSTLAQFSVGGTS